MSPDKRLYNYHVQNKCRRLTSAQRRRHEHKLNRRSARIFRSVL